MEDTVEAFPDITVNDIRKMASFFNVNVTDQRIFLHGNVFVNAIITKLHLDIDDYMQNDNPNEYVKELYTLFPKLTISDLKSQYEKIYHFIGWISHLRDVDNLMLYLKLPESIVVRTILSFKKKLSVVVNKKCIRRLQNTKWNGFESAFVGVEPIANTFNCKAKSITIQCLHVIIDLLPAYFLKEKYFINYIKPRWDDMRPTNIMFQKEYDSILNEFMETHNNVRFGYDKQDFLNDALSKSTNFFHLYRINDSYMPIRAAVQRVNALLQGFDILDIDSKELDKKVSLLESKYHVSMKYVVFNSDRDTLQESFKQSLLELHSKAALVLTLMSLAKTSVTDMYNIYINPDLRITSLSDMLSSHACDGITLLEILSNLTRTQRSPYGQTYSNESIFQSCLDVILKGTYPIHITGRIEYMSIKKRFLSLRIAQMYMELQFTAYLKYARIIDNCTNFMMFWHSLFNTTPSLLKRLLLSFIQHNDGLQHIPIYLLADALLELRHHREIENRKIQIEFGHVLFTGNFVTTFLYRPYMVVKNYLSMFHTILGLNLDNFNMQRIFMYLHFRTKIDPSQVLQKHFRNGNIEQLYREFTELLENEPNNVNPQFINAIRRGMEHPQVFNYNQPPLVEFVQSPRPPPPPSDGGRGGRHGGELNGGERGGGVRGRSRKHGCLRQNVNIIRPDPVRGSDRTPLQSTSLANTFENHLPPLPTRSITSSDATPETSQVSTIQTVSPPPSEKQSNQESGDEDLNISNRLAVSQDEVSDDENVGSFWQRLFSYPSRIRREQHLNRIRQQNEIERNKRLAERALERQNAAGDELILEKIRCEEELEREREEYRKNYIEINKYEKRNEEIPNEQRNAAKETYKRMIQLRRQLIRLEEMLAERRCRT